MKSIKFIFSVFHGIFYVLYLVLLYFFRFLFILVNIFAIIFNNLIWVILGFLALFFIGWITFIIEIRFGGFYPHWKIFISIFLYNLSFIIYNKYKNIDEVWFGSPSNNKPTKFFSNKFYYKNSKYLDSSKKPQIK